MASYLFRVLDFAQYTLSSIRTVTPQKEACHARYFAGYNGCTQLYSTVQHAI